MSQQPEKPDTLFDLPSYADWLRLQNEDLDAAGFPPSAARRAQYVASRTPLLYLEAVANRAAYQGTINYLKRQNRKAVTVDEKTSLYLKPEQLQLSQLEGWLVANYDRRIADAQAELKWVTDWCSAHPESQLTAGDIYAKVGIEMP